MRRDLLGAGSRGCPIRKAWRPGTRPWATSRASAARRSRGSATGIDEGAGEFLTRPLDHTWFPYVFVRRHPPGRESGPAGGLPSPGGRHRRVGPGAPGDPGTWPWGTPRPPTSGSAFLRSLRERGLKVPSPTIRRAWCWSPVTRTPVSGPRSRRSCPGPPGRRCRPPRRTPARPPTRRPATTCCPPYGPRQEGGRHVQALQGPATSLPRPHHHHHDHGHRPRHHHTLTRILTRTLVRKAH